MSLLNCFLRAAPDSFSPFLRSNTGLSSRIRLPWKPVSKQRSCFCEPLNPFVWSPLPFGPLLNIKVLQRKSHNYLMFVFDFKTILAYECIAINFECVGAVILRCCLLPYCRRVNINSHFCSPSLTPDCRTIPNFKRYLQVLIKFFNTLFPFLSFKIWGKARIPYDTRPPEYASDFNSSFENDLWSQIFGRTVSVYFSHFRNFSHHFSFDQSWFY